MWKLKKKRMRPKYSKARISLVSKLEQALSGKVEGLQRNFYNLVLDYYRSKLSINGNVIKNTTSNLNIITDLSALEESFFKKQTSKLLVWIARRMVEVNGVNRQYFKANSSDYNANIRRRIENNMLAAYGIKVGPKKVTIKKGGWLYGLGQFKDPYLRVKQEALNAVRAGISLDDFRKTIKNAVVDSKTQSIKHHFYTHANDTFAEYNRQASKQYADKLNMKYFMYNGGIIDTTRLFCEQRDGKVFTSEEIDKWHLLINRKDGPQWSGGIYNPYTHLGGHNCRHDLDPISDRLAFRLRPELKPKVGKK